MIDIAMYSTKRLSLFVISTFITLLSTAQSPTSFFQNSLYSSPKREVRAVWLTTIGGLDWPHSYARNTYSIEQQRQELRTILDKYRRAGINTVLLQTRIRGTVIYPSMYEPWDGCLSGVPGRSPGYDALAFAIDECHKRGMELQAWVVTIPVGKWNGLGCRTLHKKYPRLIHKIGDEGYLNPEKEQTADYLADICEEIARNYDIDGIHLDYIRYPETWTMRVSRNEGRRNITRIVESIGNRVKRLKPWVKMSCSPIGKFDDLSRYRSNGWNAYTKVCQDAQGWLRGGLMDQLFPMMYFKDNQFFPFALNWQEESHGRTIVPGLGIYFMAPNEKNWPLSVIRHEMHVSRLYGMGHAYFRGKFLTDNLKGIYDFACNDFCRYPALVPAMTWQHATPPEPPTGLQIDTKTATMSWQGARDRSNAPYLMYNVYAARQAPVNVTDARNLVAVRLRQTSIRLPFSSGMAYAVTAIDRYGNESAPLQSHRPEIAEQPLALPTQLLACNGRQLELPAKESTLDASYVVIETLQGQLIATRRYEGTTADVSALPEGMYILRSVGRKGNTHRLGCFMIKRK